MKTKFKLLPVFAAALACLVFFMSLSGAEAGTGGRSKYVEGEALVLMKNNQEAGALGAASRGGAKAYAARAAESAGTAMVKTYNSISESGVGVLFHVKSDTKTTEEIIAEFSKNPDVISVSPNYIMRGMLTPDDMNQPGRPDLWGMKKINAESAWDTATGDANTYVVVLDTGVDWNHPDLAANVDRTHSMNFVPDAAGYVDAANYYDGEGHGTHVSGIIGAVGNNGQGVAGVCWNVKIISLKVMDDEGSAPLDRIAAGLNHLRDILVRNPGLRVAAVNMSIGAYVTTAPAQYVNTVLGAALSSVDSLNRAVITVAAGNEGLEVGAPAQHGGVKYNVGEYVFPASMTSLNNMIVVGSIESNGAASLFTNWSSRFVDLAAPGGRIYSTVPGGYDYNSGTSMAAPHVAGAAALLKSAQPSLSASALKSALLNNANTSINPSVIGMTLGSSGILPQIVTPQAASNKIISRYGFLDVDKALEAVSPSQPSQPSEPAQPLPSYPVPSYPDYSSGESSSGGCSSLYPAALMLLALIPVLKKK